MQTMWMGRNDVKNWNCDNADNTNHSQIELFVFYFCVCLCDFLRFLFFLSLIFCVNKVQQNEAAMFVYWNYFRLCQSPNYYNIFCLLLINIVYLLLQSKRLRVQIQSIEFKYISTG